jgi:hypothetical protein
VRNRDSGSERVTILFASNDFSKDQQIAGFYLHRRTAGYRMRKLQSQTAAGHVDHDSGPLRIA